MKKLTIICFGIIALTSSAFAGSMDCSNAEQTFTYSYFISNGGAHMEKATVSYNGISQSSLNHQGKLDITFKTMVVISTVDPVTEITTAWAEGQVTADGQTSTFSEPVICKVVASVACHGPNGQPCP